MLDPMIYGIHVAAFSDVRCFHECVARALTRQVYVFVTAGANFQLPAQRSRFPPAHTRSCSHALVSHSSAMHVRQEREDNASILAAASRRKLRRRWRGLGRAIGRLLALHKQVMEQTYAPGGAGYERARAEFRLCV